MEIDHIFIFTNDKGKIADELVEFGLTEGSNRVHLGQGTTNRKFYFDNFFLEILWVHDEEELKSDIVKSTGLWQRADFSSIHSPFGLCIVNTYEANNLFLNAYKYQPAYFPVGLNIEILKNEQNLNLPWTFKLPFKGQKKNEVEPIEHKNGMIRLTSVEFGILNFDETDGFIQHFSRQENIKFLKSSKNNLTLIFDDYKNGLTKEFNKLNLKIKY